jgi:predicted TIM-barrel fold metal-dependent hydrolase
MPFFLESLDYQLYETAPSAVAELSMLPSEYFQRQVYGCFWFEARQLQSVIDALGVTQVLFETDFPHPTCLYPNPLGTVADKLATLRPETRRKLLGENAAKLYRL